MEEKGVAPRGQWWQDKVEHLLSLAKNEGSPLYVYDEATIRNAAAKLRSLSAIDHLFYAIKANPNADGTIERNRPTKKNKTKQNKTKKDQKFKFHSLIPRQKC